MDRVGHPPRRARRTRLTRPCRRPKIRNQTAEAADGIRDRSLREVAAAVGTSHRMLLHHFASREELLLAIVDEVERRQMVILADLPTDPADGFAAMWAHLCRPELRPFERLFFEC